MLTSELVPQCVDLSYVKKQQVPKYTSQNVVTMVSTAMFIVIKKYIYIYLVALLPFGEHLQVYTDEI
jgi:hypothetical protein